MKHIKVTSIIIPNPEQVAKVRTVRGPGFAVRSVLKLADGTERQDLITSDKKKDLPRAIERKQQAANAGAMALFNQ